MAPLFGVDSFFHVPEHTHFLNRDQPVARPLLVHRTTQTRNKYTQMSKGPVGFEPQFSVFKRDKTVHALKRTSTVVGPLTGTSARDFPGVRGQPARKDDNLTAIYEAGI
jgi:hypothetical protein